MADRPHAVWGVVLAGGRGERLGGRKPSAVLAGRPLVSYPVEAMRAAGLRVVIVAKGPLGVDLPDDVALLVEPADPVHPLFGIQVAIEHLGDAVVVCPADMPFIPPGVVAMLAAHPHDGAVVTAPQGEVQPLLARYGPQHLDAIRAAVSASRSARAFVAGLDGVRIVGDDVLARFGDIAQRFMDVDSQDDLVAAQLRAGERFGS